MIRRILTVVAVAGVLLGLLATGGWFILQPPPIAVPPQERLVFADVTVLNPGLDRRAGQILTVQDGRIASIAADAPASRESGVTPSFAGAYALPGLIDMHVHNVAGEWELFGLLFLMHGVTAVRDTGRFDTTPVAQRQKVLAGAYPGPRFFACGPILDGDPPFSPLHWPVGSPAAARKAVDEVAAAGVDCVKVYWSLSTNVLTAIRHAAQRHDLPVAGHIPFAVPFEAAGLDDVQHLTGVPLHEDDPDASAAARLGAWAASWRELDATRIDFIVQTSVEQQLVHTPTLFMWAQAARSLDYARLLDDPAAQLLPRWYRAVFWRPLDAFLPAYASLGEALPQMKETVRRLHEAGVRIHTGSDTPLSFVVPGASLHGELRLLVEAGLTPEEAWVAATRWAGEFLGVPKLGTLQAGAPADFLLFREDPTQDLAALSTLEAVVAQGRLYPKAMLDKAFERHRTHFSGWLYDRLTMAMAAVLAWMGSPDSDAQNPALRGTAKP